MRVLRMPLVEPAEPTGTDGLIDWVAAIRSSEQPCLLVAVDGALITLSEPARALFGPAARPGLPMTMWWRERGLQPGDGAPQSTLLERTINTGAPAHSVLALELSDAPATVQVLIAPLQRHDASALGVLAFVWTMTRRQP